MRKMNLNLGWLVVIIPLGLLIFVVFPEIQDKYEDYASRKATHEAKVVVLDSLLNLAQPSTRDLNEIRKLETQVRVHGIVLTKERFLGLKLGGMFVVFIFMFGGMFLSGIWLNRKKNAAQNRQITFHYEDPSSDAIGQAISWVAISSGGSNFLSERLKKTSRGFTIVSSSKMKFMAWGFFLVGLNWFVWGLVEWMQTKGDIGFMDIGKLFFTSGGPFMLVGLFLVLATGAKAYFYIRKRIMVVDAKKRSFQEAYALQVLQKFVAGNSSGGYYCYELNLVTDTGERINLLNHGDKDYLLSDMVMISRFLKVPVWNRGVV
ncbi:hypothetical protein [Sediminicola luteus]|nr:hypothetical protein [Sediminicola luteus]